MSPLGDGSDTRRRAAGATVGRLGSLTSQLQDKHGPVWHFLVRYLDIDSIKGMRLEVRPEFAAAQTMLSAPMPSWEHALVGTAFDYRLRYAFAITPAEQLVAALGARRLSIPALAIDHQDLDQRGKQGGTYRIVDTRPTDPIVAEVAGAFMARLDTSVSALAPLGHRLDRADEERLARHCLVLAAFEQVFRSGLLGERSPLIFPTPCTNIDELLARARSSWVEDLCSMATAFHEVADRDGLFEVPSVLNPTFEGSADMRADADVILGGSLLDIKCTVEPSLSLEWLAQLLGYVLLDYADAYSIESVGFYFARQAILLRWPLARLIGHEVSKTELAGVRAQFRRLLKGEQ